MGELSIYNAEGGLRIFLWCVILDAVNKDYAGVSVGVSRRQIVKTCRFNLGIGCVGGVEHFEVGAGRLRCD